jgi:hypothetical protein
MFRKKGRSLTSSAHAMDIHCPKLKMITPDFPWERHLGSEMVVPFGMIFKGVKGFGGNTRNQNARVVSRHSGMPLAGIHSGAFLDSGQNRAGMTKGKACS